MHDPISSLAQARIPTPARDDMVVPRGGIDDGVRRL
jgi:hypothetical protein